MSQARQNQQNDLCTQLRLRSAWAYTQSGQSLCCQYGETLSHYIFEHTVKTLIRLGECPGWSEPSLGAYVIFFGFIMLQLKLFWKQFLSVSQEDSLVVEPWDLKWTLLLVCCVCSCFQRPLAMSLMEILRMITSCRCYANSELSMNNTSGRLQYLYQAMKRKKKLSSRWATR